MSDGIKTERLSEFLNKAESLGFDVKVDTSYSSGNGIEKRKMLICNPSHCYFLISQNDYIMYELQMEILNEY